MQLPRELRALFAKGNDAAVRENYDYAIALFMQILQKEPTCFECRKALRAVQMGKAGGRTSFFKKVMSSAGSSPQLAKGQLVLRRDPTEALAMAEQILSSDPYSSAGHRLVADAAHALDLPQTAILSLELLVKHTPKDRELVTRLANALADAGDTGRAEQLLVELARHYPGDAEVQQSLKNLSARKTLDEGGYDALSSGEGSYRDILKDKEEAVELEQEKRVVKTEDVSERLILEYEGRLQTEPNNLKMVRSLADLYTQKKRFRDALALLDRVKTSEMGSDPSLDRAVADIKVRQFEHQLAQLDPSAPDHAEQVAKLNADRLGFQIEDCRQRVERFPTDLAVRFEMGTLLFQAGQISEAIQEFQKAQGNPHKRIAAMGYLGQCFARRKMFDLAARTLQNAIKEKPVFDEEKKDLIYNLGAVLDSMGKKDEAIEQFKLIYELDIGYRDVAARVDAYYAAQ